MPLQLTDQEKYCIPTLTKVLRIKQELNDAWSYHRRRWVENSQFCDPNGLRLFDRDYTDQGGDIRSQSVINPISRQAPDIFSAGAMTLASNKGSEWFSLVPRKRGLEFGKGRKDKEGLEYIKYAETELRDDLAQSTFYDALFPGYKDLSVYSNMGIIAQEDIEKTVNYRHKAAGSYMIQLDSNGHPRDYYTEFSMTVSQIIERFGRDRVTDELVMSRLPEMIRTAKEGAKYRERYRVIHTILLNPKRKPNEEGLLGARYIGMYYLSQGILSGGYGSLYPSGSPTFDGSKHDNLLEYEIHDQHPFLFAPWSRVERDTYGVSGPADTCLKIIKGLQHSEYRTNQAIDFAVMPHYLGSSRLNLDTDDASSLRPGGITTANDIAAIQAGLTPIHKNQWRIDQGEGRIMRYSDLIKDTFYWNLILKVVSLDKTHITAAQINEIVGERLLVLVPMYSRIEAGILERGIQYHLSMTYKHGKLDSPPDSLLSEDGQSFELAAEYQSILAKTQAAAQVSRDQRYLDIVMKYGEMLPGMKRKVRGARFADGFADDMGVNPAKLYSDEEVQEIAEEEARQQQAMQEAQQAKEEAGAVKDMALAGKAAGEAGEGVGGALGAG